jgi:hypothetical protein
VDKFGSLAPISRRVHIQGYFKRYDPGAISTDSGDHLAYLLGGEQLAGCLVGGHEVHAIPLGRSLQRLAVWPASSEPDRDARGLQGFGKHAYLLDLVVLTLEIEDLAAPKPG